MKTGQAGSFSAARRILIVGTGGQGVLTAARLLCECLVDRGHHVVSGQLHGMAQRGGAVQSSVIVDGGVSPVIPSGRADFVLGLEPVETARALPFMASQTVVFMNTAPVIPFIVTQQVATKKGNGGYPDIPELCETVRAQARQTYTLDATRRASQVGSVQTLNIVMLGCLLGLGPMPCTADEFWKYAENRIPPKLKDVNARAFRTGVEFAEQECTVGPAP